MVSSQVALLDCAIVIGFWAIVAGAVGINQYRYRKTLARLEAAEVAQKRVIAAIERLSAILKRVEGGTQRAAPDAIS